MWISIYLDDVLAYYQDGITEESQPISLELDLTGYTTMRIETGNEGTYSYGILLFANTSFEKVNEGTESQE